jgi:uncharacterized membrane protein YfcA
MYMRSIGAGFVVGGTVGSVVGSLVGFAVSTISIPFVLLFSAIETVFDECKRKKD